MNGLSPEAVIVICLGIAGLAIGVGVFVELLQERADRKRRARRGGYLDIGPRGRKRLP